MLRRKFVKAFGIVAVASGAYRIHAAIQLPSWQKLRGRDMFEKIKYLSDVNPLATEDQRDHEKLSLELIKAPEIIRAKERATDRLRWLCKDGVPSQVADRIEVTMEEWTLHYVMMALNSDANNPKVINNYFEPEHKWFGLDVPGNRTFGGENWDNTYTIIPVDPYGYFELHGKRMNPGTADASFSIMGNIGVAMTLDSIALQELDVAPDGSFTITISPEPAKIVNGRRNNHLQTKLDACYLLIRNTRSDWRQIPNKYSFRRVSESIAPALTLEQIVDRAARHTVEDVASNHWFMVTPTHPPVNHIPQPFGTGSIGGLVSQGIIQANLRIDDDEAFVITLSSGDAKSHVLTLYDFWLCKMPWEKTTSLNNSQAIPNPDGTYTYVISHEDPSVYNWIDTTGIREPRIMNRWHAMPPDTVSTGKLWTKGQLVKLKDLESILPDTMVRVTKDERVAQLKERRENFLVRYLDH